MKGTRTQTAPVRRRRGPRFTGEDRETTQKRIIQAAVDVVESKGISALTFKRVAASRRLGITRTALFHYFGSRAGLVAAIVAWVFGELAARMSRAMQPHRGTPHALVAVSLAYAEYALRTPELYRTAHHPDLWRHTTRKRRHVRKTSEADWLERASRASADALNVVVYAVEQAQDAGLVVHTEDIGSSDIANLLTSVVNGYVFQVLDEHGGREPAIVEHLDYLKKLVDVALTGVVEASPD